MEGGVRPEMRPLPGTKKARRVLQRFADPSPLGLSIEMVHRNHPFLAIFCF